MHAFYCKNKTGNDLIMNVFIWSPFVVSYIYHMILINIVIVIAGVWLICIRLIAQVTGGRDIWWFWIKSYLKICLTPSSSSSYFDAIINLWKKRFCLLDILLLIVSLIHMNISNKSLLTYIYIFLGLFIRTSH